MRGARNLKNVLLRRWMHYAPEHMASGAMIYMKVNMHMDSMMVNSAMQGTKTCIMVASTFFLGITAKEDELFGSITLITTYQCGLVRNRWFILSAASKIVANSACRYSVD